MKNSLDVGTVVYVDCWGPGIIVGWDGFNLLVRDEHGNQDWHPMDRVRLSKSATDKAVFENTYTHALKDI